MCGRLACTLCPEDILKACQYTDKNGKLSKPKWVEETGCTYKPFYNGPPTTTVPVMVYKTHFCENNEGITDYCVAPMKWGLIPSFKTDSPGFLHTHNARIESVMKSNMYKPALVSGGRCIIVAEGFYEWQTAKGAMNKQPYFIYQNPCEAENSETQKKDKEDGNNEKYLMKMAGLFTKSKSDGEVKYSCTIFTTESDSSLSWLHHRMPVILNTQDEIEDWLNYKTVDHAAALSLISKSFEEKVDESHKLKYYTVDKNYVNKSTCNEPKCMEKMSVKRPNTLDGWLTAKKKK